MVGKSKTWTKTQKDRGRRLKEMGCYIFRHELGLGWRLPDLHHILDGGRRISHDHVIPLDPWFHEGHPPQGMTIKEAKEAFGPSLKLHKREFTERFGTERQILDRVNQVLQEQ